MDNIHIIYKVNTSPTLQDTEWASDYNIIMDKIANNHNVFCFGMGLVGTLFCKEIQHYPVCFDNIHFVDNNPTLQGTSINIGTFNRTIISKRKMIELIRPGDCIILTVGALVFLPLYEELTNDPDLSTLGLHNIEFHHVAFRTPQSDPIYPEINSSMAIKAIEKYDAFHPIDNSMMSENSAYVDVIICVHNALSDVKNCLQSVVSNNSYGHNIIVVDDGSDDETKDYLVQYCNMHSITLLRNNTPQGYTASANQGLRHSKADYLVLLNSDTVVTKYWIEKMVQLFTKEKNLGIAGPLSNAAILQSIPNMNADGIGNNLPKGLSPQLMSNLIERVSTGAHPKISIINGFCFMMSRQLVDTIGFFDIASFPKGYGEEYDYCIRAKAAGFDLRVLDNTYIFHNKSKSFGHTKRLYYTTVANFSLARKHGLHVLKQINKEMTNNKGTNNIRSTIAKIIIQL